MKNRLITFFVGLMFLSSLSVLSMEQSDLRHRGGGPNPKQMLRDDESGKKEEEFDCNECCKALCPTNEDRRCAALMCGVWSGVAFSSYQFYLYLERTYGEH